MRIGINQTILQPIQRTNHTSSSSVQNMRINHSRTYIAVPQQFLYRPYIISNLKKMRCKRVSEGMATGVLGRFRNFSSDFSGERAIAI